MKETRLGWVSIIMPCYNGAYYISRSFSSVLEQSYPYIQLVFVDDGSHDNSADVAESFRDRFIEKNYELVTLSQENQGIAAACDKGIDSATGEYYCLLDVDDALMPNSIEKRVRIFQENEDCSIVKTNAYRVNESDGTRVLLNSAFNTGIIKNAFELYVYGLIDNFAGTYMVRAKNIIDFYKDKEFIKSRYGQNLQIILPASYLGNHYYINEPHLLYYIHSDSHSNCTEITKLIDLLEGYNRIRVGVLNQINPSLDILNKQKFFHLCHMLNNVICFTRCEEIIPYYNYYYNQLKESYNIPIMYRMYHAYFNKEWIKFFVFRLINFIERKLHDSNHR